MDFEHCLPEEQGVVVLGPLKLTELVELVMVAFECLQLQELVLVALESLQLSELVLVAELVVPW